ncbi:zinc finger CCCH domain-containing protein 3 isoform X1 [Typha latifolia]|uniref:zinc finger CCCH domain-containing protein 3 isoform X1 n=1 Tax=Typha latifolia TaxID=4733 RepID=UPI003C2FCF8D
MPDTGQGQDNAVSNSTNASPENLEEVMWRLEVDDGQENGDGSGNQYPDRPGEPDCIFYLRTGMCGYGANCRYNHPTFTGEGTQYRGELPQREGQPDCQFFLKTGTCKFGATCKYHHPRDKFNARSVPLNILGLPMREDEKSCPYYMRTGLCKFGVGCKFNHPQPTTANMFPAMGPSSYGSTSSSIMPQSSLSLVGGLSSWPSSRSPYMSSGQMQGLPAYMPLVLPPTQGNIPMQQGWSTYMQGSVSHISNTDVLGPNQMSSTKNHSQSSFSTSSNLPERPDQPECQYYMRLGRCKYGSSCKYHHPKERNQVAASTIGPYGLPLRPGQPVCNFYSLYGSCKYGPACKFDHPLVGYYNYALPAYSITDPSLFVPDQRSSHVVLASPERLQAKTSRSPDQYVKPETSDDDVQDNEHVDPSPTTPSSHTSQLSQSPKNHTD